jgi:hypothetical protein
MAAAIAGVLSTAAEKKRARDERPYIFLEMLTTFSPAPHGGNPDKN